MFPVVARDVDRGGNRMRDRSIVHCAACVDDCGIWRRIARGIASTTSIDAAVRAM